MSSVIAIIFLILSSSCANSVSATVSIGSRSILRSINDDKAGKPDLAVELNATNFDAVHKETPATFALVEFFAHWSPACRNYKPQYEKVAKLFNGADAVHPRIILMTRVDCALKVNTNLCSKFSVEHYPILLWGPSSKFVSGSWGPKQDKSEIHYVDGGRTADRLLNWINKKMNSSYSLDDEKRINQNRENQIKTIPKFSKSVDKNPFQPWITDCGLEIEFTGQCGFGPGNESNEQWAKVPDPVTQDMKQGEYNSG